ncbi:hypothetical protein BVRB_9g214510 [Beta vulgaris subsp. vulgaris]|nr:hypothetical protein BVRB_9g214510 [Beta vulgaris subsp. vulgaris]
MAATVSSVWAKPGAWALDSEEHEDELNQPIMAQTQKPEPPASDFPSLAAASVAKPKKKNKAQTLSLAEFTTYGSTPKPASASVPKRLTQDEILMLPTGPRERTAEELERPRLGGGFRNYGGGMGDNSRVRVSDRNSNRESFMGSSRADDVDDWSKEKKFSSFGGGPSSDRREKVGFFNSSRADEVDNWASNKSFVAAPVRERRMGFESYSNGSGPDSDTWSRKRDDRSVNGGGVEGDTWGKRESNGNGSGRPRLNLQPRTLPVVSGNNGGESNAAEGKSKGANPFGEARPTETRVLPVVSGNDGGQSSPIEAKPRGANPFGEARPREEVLAEKGKDWKEIDEKLEAVKIKEVGSGDKGEGLGWRRGFGTGEEKTVKTWRKPESTDAVSSPSGSSADTTENSANTTESIAESAEKVSEEN